MASRMGLSRRRLLVLSAGVIAGLGLTASGQAADDAVDTVRGFYETLLAVMKEGKQASFDKRYARLAPAIERAFNLALMIRIAVGPAWAGLPTAQQQRLVEAFKRYTVSTYTNRFDDFSGERFEVSPTPVSNPNGTIVETRLVPTNGEAVTLNYLLRHDGAGAWQIIDVFLSGTVSELATRRSEFATVLQQDGAEGLARLLDERSSKMRAG